MSQELLLRIVKTWNLNEKPEYRGFRCANCQEYMNKAWYHWLTEGGYRAPVHFCESCESDYESSKMVIAKPEVAVDMKRFGMKFPEELERLFRELQSKWDTDADPVYKTFTCDKCDKDMQKAYHVWFNMDNTLLVEEHFCKECGDELGLDKLD
jgi:hypothetical protein